MTQPTYAAPSVPTPDPPPRSGLVYLREQVANYFNQNGIAATVAPVGLKYRSFQINQTFPGGANRIVFIPGEFDGENLLKSRPFGTLNRQIRQSAEVINPRELLCWERAVTLSIWSPPVTGSREDEEGALAIAENLLEQVVRAVQYVPDPSNPNASISASILWGDVLYKSPPVESAFGVELLVSLIQLVPLFDTTLDVVYPSAVVSRIGA